VQRPEQVEAYRRMTVRERLRLTIELIEFAEAALAALPPDERERRLRIAYGRKGANDLGIGDRLDQAMRDAGR
jgi:hypothetical protein